MDGSFKFTEDGTYRVVKDVYGYMSSMRNFLFEAKSNEVTIENKKEDKKEDKTTATTPTSQITTIKKKEIQIAKPSRVVKLKIKKSSKRSVKISWKKQKNASGYEVYRSTKKNKSFKKITTLKKAGKVIYVNKKLKKGKTYYYKVRAYKTVNGKTIYSNFSRYSGTTVKVLNLMKNLPPLSPSYVGKYSTIINKIGGMHKKSNSGYPSFYAAGNKMIIGVNYNAKYSKNQKYVYICNRGNYGVGIGGMQLGMTLSKATAILNKNGLRSFNNPTVFWWGNAASITLTIKNNIVTGFTYACAPTCD